MEVPAVKDFQWKRLAPLPSRRVYCSLLETGGQVYAIGGCDDNGVPMDCFEVYSPEADQWTALAPLPTGCPRNRSCSGKSPNKPVTARQPAACSGRLLSPWFLGPKSQRLAPKARCPQVPSTRSRRAARCPMAAFSPNCRVLLPEI